MSERRARFSIGSPTSSFVVAGMLVVLVAFVTLLARQLSRLESARRAQLREAKHAGAHYTSAVAPPPIEDPRVSLGRKLFFDTSLSNPEGTSCASCHDPSQGYAGNNGSRIGTARGSRAGRYAQRNTPSVMYLRFVRKPQLVWDDETDRPELFGGFFWDGRAATVAAVVAQPLLNPNEMGNRDVRQIARKIKRSAYANELLQEFDAVFASDDNVMQAISFCIEAFLTSRAMSPFSSKYDDFVRGRGTLSALELRGLALFEDLDKGACSACHRLNQHSELPESSLFTDYGYDAVAVPRNRALPDNRDPRRYDLGLCQRRDPRFHTEDRWFCGSFRTPSLRNVAKRQRFMHNGFFSKLRDVVSFYATRSTDPERWYGKQPFDDLPAQYHDNINVSLPPYDQLQGERPRLLKPDIDAIVAFLETLSDRSVPPAPCSLAQRCGR